MNVSTCPSLALALAPWALGWAGGAGGAVIAAWLAVDALAEELLAAAELAVTIPPAAPLALFGFCKALATAIGRLVKPCGTSTPGVRNSTGASEA